MEKVYICSPYKGDTKRNIEYAKELCRKEILKGNFPIAPHIYLTQFLDDDKEEERQLGIDIGIKLSDECNDMVIGNKYGISSGMQKEIEYFNNKKMMNK